MQPYRAFLLRCWSAHAASSDTAITWRFSLEEVGPERQVLAFASLEALTAYLGGELSDGERFSSTQPCELLTDPEGTSPRGDTP